MIASQTFSPINVMNGDSIQITWNIQGGPTSITHTYISDGPITSQTLIPDIPNEDLRANKLREEITYLQEYVDDLEMLLEALSNV